MQKSTMLYASPFNPMQSGISDYSEVLVNALLEQYDITLLTRDYKMTNQDLAKRCKILNYDKDEIPFDQFDYIVYNIGNQPYYHDYIYQCCLAHPGLVILHDFSLYFLFIGVHGYLGDTFSKIYELEGAEGIHCIKKTMMKHSTNLLECKDLASVMPLNQEILQSNNRFMVHSEYAKNKILETGCVDAQNVRKINHISLLGEDMNHIPKKDLYAKYGIPEDAIIIASFGYIVWTKLNHVVCQVVSDLNQKLERKVCYIMVGDGGYVDNYVDSKTIFKTGYTELEDFNSFIQYADIIINLRHPSMGETSGSLIRILELGKVCIVSDEGWFSELPDDCVIKIGMHNIEEVVAEKIQLLIQDETLKQQYAENAKQYIRTEYSTKKIVGEISDFLASGGTT